MAKWREHDDRDMVGEQDIINLKEWKQWIA